MEPLKVNKTPLHLQAQEHLLGLIEEGAYQPGEQLPSEVDLAAQLGISRPTLREALLYLEQEGFIIRKHGVGTFVAPEERHRLEGGLERLESILEMAVRQGIQVGYDDLQVQEEPASPELAEKLRVPPGTPLTSVRRVLVVGDAVHVPGASQVSRAAETAPRAGPRALSERSSSRAAVPVSYMLDVAPASILSPEDVYEQFRGSVLDLLRHKPDLEIAQAVADIVARDADAFLARKLGIETGQAVLLLEETLYNQAGEVVEFSYNYFVPDFFRFHVVRR